MFPFDYGPLKTPIEQFQNWLKPPAQSTALTVPIVPPALPVKDDLQIAASSRPSPAQPHLGFLDQPLPASVSTLPQTKAAPATPAPKITFNKPIALQPGVNLFMPQNPVKPDGSVDIIVQFRGVVPERFSEGGVNAVVITCETEGLSGAMMAKFGAPSFVPSMIEKAMAKVHQHYGPDIKEGHLALGSFSAGYAPLAVALTNPAVRAKADSVMVIDGIHYGAVGKPNPAAHQPFVDFAQEASQGNKLMVITHSAIKPSYSSSTDAADYILKQVGAQRVAAEPVSGPYKNRYGKTMAPETRADVKGFHVAGFHGGQADNHMEQIDNLGNLWNQFLAPRWQ